MVSLAASFFEAPNLADFIALLGALIALGAARRAQREAERYKDPPIYG